MFDTGCQEYSSKNTVKNHMKIPQLFTKVIFKSNTICLDYGGGPWDTVTSFLKDKGVTVMVYDKYNRSKDHNEAVEKWICENEGVDYVTCSNVLNVIKEENVQREILNDIWKALKCNGTAYFIMYEGDRSGIGSSNKMDCYQANKRMKEYLPMIQEIFPNATLRGGIIAGRKEGDYE